MRLVHQLLRSEYARSGSAVSRSMEPVRVSVVASRLADTHNISYSGNRAFSSNSCHAMSSLFLQRSLFDWPLRFHPCSLCLCNPTCFVVQVGINVVQATVASGTVAPRPLSTSPRRAVVRAHSLKVDNARRCRKYPKTNGSSTRSLRAAVQRSTASSRSSRPRI